MKINQGIKFGTLKKPMFSFFDVIIFDLMGKQNKIFWERLPVNNLKIIASLALFGAKKEIIAPGYYSRKYGIYL